MTQSAIQGGLPIGTGYQAVPASAVAQPAATQPPGPGGDRMQPPGSQNHIPVLYTSPRVFGPNDPRPARSVPPPVPPKKSHVGTTIVIVLAILGAVAGVVGLALLATSKKREAANANGSSTPRPQRSTPAESPAALEHAAHGRQPERKTAKAGAPAGK